MTEQFFIFGAGYSGRAFGRLAANEAEIVGTTRSPERFERLRAAGAPSEERPPPPGIRAPMSKSASFFSLIRTPRIKKLVL